MSMTSPYPSSTAPSSDHSTSAHRSNATTGGSTSALRTRNRRFISTELTSPGPGGHRGSENRDVSPIPSRHPSRMAGSQRTASGVARPVGGLVRSAQDTASGALSPSAGFGRGIWEGGWTGSWTALQGLASSVLGTDVVESNSDGEGAGKGRQSGPARLDKASGHGTAKKEPSTWGPSGASRRGHSIGVGTLEERDLAVKASKMASVLESHEGANGGLDVNGNYKRRTSLERPKTPGQVNEGQDALVYVHYVQPSDTLVGVVLKYNCQPALFRKANGLYPNDMIQIRNVVFVPVDACAIKGVPCDPPPESKAIDLLAPTPGTEDPPSSGRSYSNGSAWSHKAKGTGSSNTPLFEAFNAEETRMEEEAEAEEKPWIHVRWVLLDSSPSAKPIEIGRLPRKTLGYFPPRRRKSHANPSSISTPRGSCDLHSTPRLSEEHNESEITTTPPQRSISASPSRGGSYFPGQTSNPSSRRDNDSTHSVTPKWLRGPGGVGTFDVRAPGPAQDSLNSWAAKHLPMLGMGHTSSSSVTGGEVASYGFPGDHSLPSIPEMPRSSSSSSHLTAAAVGQGMGLEHAAAAIEGWVRRFATKAATAATAAAAAATPGTPKLGLGTRTAVPPELGEGDLIELLDGAGSDDGRGGGGGGGGFEPLSGGAAGSGRHDHHAAPAGGGGMLLRGGRIQQGLFPPPTAGGAKGKSD